MSATLDTAILKLIRKAADAAIMPRYRQLKASQVVDKSVGELVTIADLECEAMLAEGLAQLLPEATVLGEEAISTNPALAERLGDRLCWIIDPLDGTNNFVQGTGGFGIMVALANNGLPIGGWIYDPLSDRFCSAHLNNGAWINGERVQTKSDNQSKPRAAISSLYADADYRSELAKSLENVFSFNSIPRCAAEVYPRLVSGELDIVLFGRCLAWDHAAGVIFLLEAGGRAARLDGSAFRVDDDQNGLIAASCSQAWERFAEAIAFFECEANG